MPMRIQSRLDLIIDVITLTTEVAEVAKLAAWCRADLHMAPIKAKDAPGYKSRIQRQEPGWIGDDLARMVMAWPLPRGRSPSTLIEQLVTRLTSLGVATESSPADVPGIGEGPA